MKVRQQSKAVLLIALLCPLLSAAPPETLKQDSPGGLGVRQQHVHRLMRELDRKFVVLAGRLGEKDPDRAKRLLNAFQQSKKLGVEQRMAGIVALLNDSRLDKPAGALKDSPLDGAAREQQQVLKDLEQLIATLLKEEFGEEDRGEEIDRLLKWRAEVERLLDEQRERLRETDQTAGKDRILAEASRRIADLKELIEQQNQLADETELVRKEGVQGLGEVADKQREIRERTEKLARKIAADQHRREPNKGEPNKGDPNKGDP
ncbi:MAG: hypothetical protein N2C14_00375, partial [Planctomycetales bacterium]